MATTALNRNLSLYLDLLRALAATLVFATHAGHFLFPYLEASHFAFVLNQGKEAVAAFFVLSGFVIAYVAATKEQNWRTYTVARIARIYPVALTAIVLTCVADGIGNYLNHGYYLQADQESAFYVPVSASAALRYLSFTNQTWYSHAVFGTDEPYWSLGFEVWYYVLFGLFLFVKKDLRLLVVIAGLAVCGPNIILYLPVWLLGACTYWLTAGRTRHMRTTSALALLAGSVLLYALVRHKTQALLGSEVTVMYYPQGLGQSAINLCYYLLIGTAVAMSIVAVHQLADKLPAVPQGIEKCIRYLASGSFMLYLIHQPLLVMLAAAFAYTTTSGVAGALASAAALGSALVLAQMVEKRRSRITRLVAWCLDPRALRSQV